MAELIDDAEDIVPLDRRLKLSIKWHKLKTHIRIGNEPETIFQVGLLIGDHPLFSDPVYEHPRGYDEDWLEPGHFSAEDSYLKILTGLWETLTTGKKLDWMNLIDPTFEMIVERHDHPGGGNTDDEFFFEFAIIIQHGGPWHTDAMGGAGPGVRLYATPQSLKQFIFDLIDEADDPSISDEEAREIVRRQMAEAIAERRESGA